MLDSLPHMHTMCNKNRGGTWEAEGFMNTFVQLHTTTMALPLYNAKFSYPDTVTSNPVSSFAQLQVRLAFSLVACCYHIQQQAKPYCGHYKCMSWGVSGFRNLVIRTRNKLTLQHRL